MQSATRPGSEAPPRSAAQQPADHRAGHAARRRRAHGAAAFALDRLEVEGLDRKAAGAAKAVEGHLVVTGEHPGLEAEGDRLELDARVLVQPATGFHVDLLARPTL